MSNECRWNSVHGFVAQLARRWAANSRSCTVKGSNPGENLNLISSSITLTNLFIVKIFSLNVPFSNLYVHNIIFFCIYVHLLLFCCIFLFWWILTVGKVSRNLWILTEHLLNQGSLIHETLITLVFTLFFTEWPQFTLEYQMSHWMFH